MTSGCVFTANLRDTRAHGTTRWIVRRGALSALLALVIVCASAGVAGAQQKLLTLDDIYAPDHRVSFSGHPATGLAWIDASHFVWPRPGVDGIDWTRIDAGSGRAEPLFDTAKMEAALATLSGMSADDARRLARSSDLEFSTQYQRSALHPFI